MMLIKGSIYWSCVANMIFDTDGWNNPRIRLDEQIRDLIKQAMILGMSEPRSA